MERARDGTAMDSQAAGEWNRLPLYGDDPDVDGHAEIRRGRMGNGGDDGQRGDRFAIWSAAITSASPAIEQLEVEVLPETLQRLRQDRLPPRDPDLPTAVLMVNGFNGLGLATLTIIATLFPEQFHNVVFICVGEVDSALFKGPEDLRRSKHRSPTTCWSTASLRRTWAFMPNCEPRSDPTW